MAHSLVLAALGAGLALGLRTDAAPAPPRRLVLFLGHTRTDDDPAYRYFARLFASQRPAEFASVQLEYVGFTEEEQRYLGSTGDDSKAGNNLQRAVARHPALIVAPNAGSTTVALRRGGSTPLVFATYMDPVRSGFVEDLQQRRPDIAGIDLTDRLDGKRFEILHEAYPQVRTVGVLVDTQWLQDRAAAARVESEARLSGLRATLLRADTREEVAALLDRPADAGYDAWYIPITFIQQRSIDIIIPRMRAIRRPCIFSETKDVEAGGLMSYSQDTSFAWTALVDLSARVLQGERAGSIPIVHPQRFELAVRTREDTGVAPPASAIVRRADVVIR